MTSAATTPMRTNGMTGTERRAVSEALCKTTSEESLRTEEQGGEQGDVEDGLRPGGAHRDLQHARGDAEDHGGDRGSGDRPQTADDDDGDERPDPVPVQRREDRGVEREGGAADGGRRQPEAEPVTGHAVGVDA